MLISSFGVHRLWNDLISLSPLLLILEDLCRSLNISVAPAHTSSRCVWFIYCIIFLTVSSLSILITSHLFNSLGSVTSILYVAIHLVYSISFRTQVRGTIISWTPWSERLVRILLVFMVIRSLVLTTLTHHISLLLNSSKLDNSLLGIVLIDRNMFLSSRSWG